jgi:mitochondrial distribution and morphology protein 31
MAWQRRARVFLWTSSVVSVSVLAYWNARWVQESLTLLICKHAAKRAALELDAEKATFSRGLITLHQARLHRPVSKAGNWSAYDITVDTLQIQLSPLRLLRRMGMIRTFSLDGVRGTIDRRHLDAASNAPSQPFHFSFDAENVSICDLLLSVLSPGNFRPYTISILSCRLPRLRSDWLFMDLLMADSMVGIFDKCLFSLHSRQDMPRWRHFKIDGVKVDHLHTTEHDQTTNVPINWLDRGAVDVDASWVLDGDKLRIRSELCFRDLHAVAPSNKLIQSALVRPLIAYLNDTRPYLSVSTTVYLQVARMHHGWSIYDTGMSSELSRAVTADLLRRAEANRVEGVKRVGLWTLWQMLKNIPTIK